MNVSKLIDPAQFEASANGQVIRLYTLRNSAGLTAQVTNLGARLVSLWLPSRVGDWADVVLGHQSAQPYLATPTNYYGATIGRFANRIGQAQLSIDNHTYALEANEGANQLHGGNAGGFHNMVWQVVETTESTLVLRHTSPDGQGGYPGTLGVTLTYSLTEENDLLLTYKATTDKATVVNLTHHSYFNLSGVHKEAAPIHDHELTIFADHYLPVNGQQIPTGQLAPVSGTPFDFGQPTHIGQRIAHEALAPTGGYDHHYALNGTSGAERLAARVLDPASGRTMEVYTTAPGMQFFSGNGMSDAQGKYGVHYGEHSALCLETQHFPDSPNHANFPSTLLQPGETYTAMCRHRFGVAH